MIYLTDKYNSTYAIQQWRRGWHKSQYWVLWMLTTQIQMTGPLTSKDSIFFLANEIKDVKKIAVLLTVLGTEAYSLLRLIIAPLKPTEKTYKQLVDAI